MGRDLAKAREVLAERILEDFKGKITGAADEPVIGDNPENLFFVGKLLTKEDDASNGYSSDVFIESVGADFYIDENQFGSAEIDVTPRGEFYYRCYPTFDQQRTAMLEEANEISDIAFGSFEELLEAEMKNPVKYKAVKMKLIPVYKKISIGDRGYTVHFAPAKLMDDSGVYGILDERSVENGQLMDYINCLKETVNEDDDRYTYVINEKTNIRDLATEEGYRKFLEKMQRGMLLSSKIGVFISMPQ